MRRDQFVRLRDICEELYPSLRLYLFDRKMLYSAPLTIFGPLVASIYVGQMHMVFRQRRQILALGQHFDGLVRGATTEARDMPALIDRMLGGAVTETRRTENGPAARRRPARPYYPKRSCLRVGLFPALSAAASLFSAASCAAFSAASA